MLTNKYDYCTRKYYGRYRYIKTSYAIKTNKKLKAIIVNYYCRGILFIKYNTIKYLHIWFFSLSVFSFSSIFFLFFLPVLFFLFFFSLLKQIDCTKSEKKEKKSKQVSIVDLSNVVFFKNIKMTIAQFKRYNQCRFQMTSSEPSHWLNSSAVTEFINGAICWPF